MMLVMKAELSHFLHRMENSNSIQSLGDIQFLVEMQAIGPPSKIKESFCILCMLLSN